MENSRNSQNEKSTAFEQSENTSDKNGEIFLNSLADLSTTEIAPKPPKKLPSVLPYVIKGIVLIILLSIMLYCISEVVESIRGYKEASNIYDEMSGMMGDILSSNSTAVSKGNKDSHGGTTESFGTPTVPNLEKDTAEDDISGTIILLKAKFKKLHETNPDVIGWISIPGTVIDYPIVQTTDNDFYLDHSITGAYLKSGAIFADFRNSNNWTDPNTVIYGHNMASGEMFAQLAKYKSGTFLRNNRYVYIYTENSIRVYTIFSAYQTDIYTPYTRMVFGDSSKFVEWIKQVYSASIKKQSGSFDFKGTNKIITLSTCTNSLDDTERFAVHAVLTEVRN